MNTEIKEYINNQTLIRHKRLMSVCDFIENNIKYDVVELHFSPKTNFPTYRLSRNYFACASNKQYISLHFSNFNAVQNIKKAYPKLSYGVGCVRIRDNQEFPIESIKEAIKNTLI